MSLTVHRRRSNKENVQQTPSQHHSLASSSKFKRNAESVGKIVRNRSRVERGVLGDMTPLKNIEEIAVRAPSVKGNNSTAKKRALEEKYKHMLDQYETKQKELDEQMLKFEKSYRKADSNHINRGRPAPILMTSEFTLAGPKPKRSEGSVIRPLVHLPIPVINHSISRELIFQPTRAKEGLRRHQTEQQQDQSDTESLPYQQTEPEVKQTAISLNGPCGRLINALSKHIDLQAELRKWRNRVTKKLQRNIEERLALAGIPKQILKLEFEQYDVLGRQSTHTEDSVANGLITAFNKCQEHWRDKLACQFQRSTVGEAFDRLDYDRTGTISPKILARELSILTGRNLRIRDVFRLCRRLSTEDNINKQLLCEVLGVR